MYIRLSKLLLLHFYWKSPMKIKSP